MSDGTDEQDVDFPQPKRPVFRVLFNYIHKHLWPHWTDAERLEFADHTSKLITLNKTIVSLQTSICQPSVGHILEKPYSIVKVTTGMAIWGVDRLNICPGMTAFLGKHACRLVAFPDTPAPGFGQPPKSLARSSAACVPEQVKHDDDIDELAEGSIRDLFGDQEESIPWVTAQTSNKQQEPAPKRAKHLSMTETLTLGRSQVSSSHHQRPSPEVECDSDACLKQRTELRDTAEAVMEERDKLRVENESLRAILTQLQQGAHNTLRVTFAEICDMRLNTNTITSSGVSSEQRKKSWDELLSKVDALFGRVAQLMESST